jgi:uncharacterized protein
VTETALPPVERLAQIAQELAVKPQQVAATAALLSGGATVPFIARYRKEATGSLDEVKIQAVRDRLAQLEELEARRDAILGSLIERKLLTDELRAKVIGASTLAALEDVYLPHRPKRRTRASIAKEQGLEPLADLLLAQAPGTDPAAEAARFLAPEKGIELPGEALAGARDIIAERVAEDAAARAEVREMTARLGVFVSKVIGGKEKEGSKFQDYFDWREPVASAPSHRILAVRRGEREGFLTLSLEAPEEEALRALERRFVAGTGPASEEVRAAVRDGYGRLLAPSIETDVRLEAKRRADLEAIRIFALNLRELLLAPPLGERAVLAFDPGFRTGCKVVALDRQGRLLRHDVVHPHSGERGLLEAGKAVLDLVARHGIEAIAVGNGTAGRETEAFLRSLPLSRAIPVVMVNESGASIYSASEVAREELPDHDVTVRGAVSIGRRLMDPLAELVKLDPKSIGVGQYQHDVDQGALKAALDDVVVSCVNAVGVEVNTASRQLLAYVSGLSERTAGAIVAHREKHGPFRSRRELLEVAGVGPRTFEQAAGFLRVRGGAHPLDASAVHPESYPVVDAMARDLGCSIAQLLGDESTRRRVDLRRYVSEKVGMPTLLDIQAELSRPGRDPRERFEPVRFAEGVSAIEHLAAGMKLEGVVTNITAFGAFVDVGVHQDGLVHVSQLADRRVGDPAEVVKVGQRVRVTVLDVDLERRRIALSMRSQPAPGPSRAGAPGRGGPAGGARGGRGATGDRPGGGAASEGGGGTMASLLADWAKRRGSK